MPDLGSSNSASNKDMKSQIWNNWDTIIWLRRKHCGKRRNCSLRAISPFPTMFSKAVWCWYIKISNYGVKGYLFCVNTFIYINTEKSSLDSTSWELVTCTKCVGQWILPTSTSAPRNWTHALTIVKLALYLMTTETTFSHSILLE